MSTGVTSNQFNHQPKVDWRTFFSHDEMVQAYDCIQQNKEPELSDNEDGGSESNPSEENLDLKELYDGIYLEKNKAETAISKKKEDEDNYHKNFNNFVRSIRKRCSSKDSQ